MRKRRASCDWAAGWGLGLGGCRGGWIQGLAVGRAPCCCPSWRRDGTPSCWERPDPQSTADHSTGKAGAGHWARRLQTGSWALDWWWKEGESISQRTAGGGTMRLLSVLRRAFLSLGYIASWAKRKVSLGFNSCHTLVLLGIYLKGLTKTHKGSSRWLLTRALRIHSYPARLKCSGGSVCSISQPCP